MSDNRLDARFYPEMYQVVANKILVAAGAGILTVTDKYIGSIILAIEMS